jgi:Flp pilus assembly protein TadG
VKNRRGRAARARHGDRGAVVVEFALILPILVMLLFGTLTGAICWEQDLAVSHASRQAARYGVTLPTSNYTSLDDWLTAVSARAVSTADGNLNTNVTGRQICVAYVYPAGTATLDKTRSRTETSTGSVSYSNSPCYTDGHPTTERRVQVDARRTGTFNAILFTKTLTLREQTVFKYEVATTL